MSGFELAYPAALWGLLLAAPILLFHLYARRRQRVVVPFVGLLREALGPSRPTSRFKYLREAASLGMRLLALACLVLAIGGLRPATAKTPPVDLMVVVDADVTTRTVEDGLTSRLAQGLDLAAAWIRHHTEGDVGVMLAADPFQVLAPLEADREAVLRTLADLRERFGGRPRRAHEAPLRAPATTDTDIDATVQAAAAAATRRGPGRVVVISAREVSPLERRGVELVIAGVGRTRDDQGFADLTIAPGRGTAYDVRARLRSEAEAPRTRRVVATLGAGGSTLFDEEVAIDPVEGAEIRFEATPPAEPGAMLRIRFETDDAYTRNDEVQAWLAPRTKPSLLVVKAKQPRAFTALVLDQLADAIDVEASGLVEVSDFAEAEMRDVVIVDGVSLPAGSLRPGAYVFLAPLAGALPFEVGQPIEKPLVWRTEAHHPLVRWLDFTAAEIQAGVPLSGAGLRPLAYADGAAVVAEGERDGVRYVALGLDPRASYLSIQTALPLFLRRAVLRLAEAPVTPLKPFYRVGEAVRPRLPIPGGPLADVAWSPFHDPNASVAAGAGAPTRIDPTGPAWRVPPGVQGAARVTTDAGEGWTGRTAFLDFAPGRTIAPVREPAEAPPPRARDADESARWLWWLIAAPLVLLALDLIILPRARRART